MWLTQDRGDVGLMTSRLDQEDCCGMHVVNARQTCVQRTAGHHVVTDSDLLRILFLQHITLVAELQMTLAKASKQN